jgi:hypothetical protein
MLVGVIPVGRNRPDSLVHAARALERYTPVDFLVTVGETPRGIRPDVHYPRPNTAAPPIVNTSAHLRFVAERLTAPFVWTADDIFPLAPWVPTVHVRAYPIARHLRDFPRVAGYSEGVREGIEVLKQWGHDPEQVPCGPIHRPILLHPDRILRCLDALSPRGSWLTVYPVLADETVPVGDCKIVGGGAVPRDDVGCLSTTGQSWEGAAGQFVRGRLSSPSRWG